MGNTDSQQKQKVGGQQQQNKNAVFSLPQVQLYQQQQQQNPQQQHAQQQMQFYHPHIISQNSQIDDTQQTFCTLESIIQDRLGTNKLFPEEDIQALLKGVLSALAYLRDSNFGHGDIHPQSIYFESNSGAFMISDAEQQGFGYLQSLERKKFSYLAPELVQALRSNNTPGQIELTNQVFFKSDVFALGLVILECTTLKSSTECFNFQYSILAQTIEERIQFVQEFYSEDMVRLLRRMLDFNPATRPDCHVLWQEVSQRVQELEQQQIIQQQQQLQYQQQQQQQVYQQVPKTQPQQQYQQQISPPQSQQKPQTQPQQFQQQPQQVQQAQQPQQYQQPQTQQQQIQQPQQQQQIQQPQQQQIQQVQQQPQQNQQQGLFQAPPIPQQFDLETEQIQEQMPQQQQVQQDKNVYQYNQQQNVSPYSQGKQIIYINGEPHYIVQSSPQKKQQSPVQTRSPGQQQQQYQEIQIQKPDGIALPSKANNQQIIFGGQQQQKQQQQQPQKQYENQNLQSSQQHSQFQQSESQNIKKTEKGGFQQVNRPHPNAQVIKVEQKKEMTKSPQVLQDQSQNIILPQANQNQKIVVQASSTNQTQNNVQRKIVLTQKQQPKQENIQVIKEAQTKQEEQPEQNGQNNLHIESLKQEIQKSKQLIDIYQKKSDGQGKTTLSPIQEQQNMQQLTNMVEQLGTEEQNIQKQAVQNESSSLDERIRQVIARSQAIRENFQ